MHQIDVVDYSPSNLIHSDLSPEEMAERMKERGDTANSMIVDVLLHMFQKAQQAKPESDVAKSEVEAAVDELSTRRPAPQLGLSVLTDENGIMQIRRALASVLTASGQLESALPPSVHKLLVTDRNDRAMEVLRQQIQDGKQRIALFSGAGHMADFEQRLKNELGMERESISWRTAWDLRDGAVEGALLETILEKALQDTLKDSFKDKLKSFLDKGESKE